MAKAICKISLGFVTNKLIVSPLFSVRMCVATILFVVLFLLLG